MVVRFVVPCSVDEGFVMLTRLDVPLDDSNDW